MFLTGIVKKPGGLKKILRGMQSKMWKQLVLIVDRDNNCIAAKNLSSEIELE